jgi:hypothetical protein
MKNRDALSPMFFFYFDLQCPIRRGMKNRQEGIKLNWTHQILIYTADVNPKLLGKLKTIEKITCASKDDG